MTTSDQEQALWESCPPGTLASTVRRIQARRRDRRRAKAVGVAGSVVVVLFAATIMVQQFGQSPAKIPGMGKITCSTVQTLLPAYVTGKLEAAVMGQMKTHLDGCPHCRERYEKAKGGTAQPGKPLNNTPQLALRT